MQKTNTVSCRQSRVGRVQPAFSFSILQGPVFRSVEFERVEERAWLKGVVQYYLLGVGSVGIEWWGFSEAGEVI